MSYLLDTNVLSEFIKKKPNIQVLKWFDDIPDHAFFVSVLSIGEIQKGIEKLEHAPKKEKIKLWLEQDIIEFFENRILPISADVAISWGKLLNRIHRPAPAIDSLLAATCLHHNLSLLTRNTKDFEHFNIEIINPWD